jgi:hypothetical protein
MFGVLFALLALLICAAIEESLDSIITAIQIAAIRLYARWLDWRTDRLMRRGMRELARQGRLSFRAREHRGYPERSEL